MATWVIPARQGSGCAFSHLMVAALVRPSTWATRQPVPAASTNPVRHRSAASCLRFVSGSCVQIGLPRPQLGHADAVPSAVTTCTTRPPNVTDSIRSTARPPRSSRREESDTASFEHGKRAYAGTSRWPRFDQKLPLTTAMITRSRATYVSDLDPSCPVKSEEPPWVEPGHRRRSTPYLGASHCD